MSEYGAKIKFPIYLLQGDTILTRYGWLTVGEDITLRSNNEADALFRSGVWRKWLFVPFFGGIIRRRKGKVWPRDMSVLKPRS